MTLLKCGKVKLAYKNVERTSLYKNKYKYRLEVTDYHMVVTLKSCPDADADAEYVIMYGKSFRDDTNTFYNTYFVYTNKPKVMVKWLIKYRTRLVEIHITQINLIKYDQKFVIMKNPRSKYRVTFRIDDVDCLNDNLFRYLTDQNNKIYYGKTSNLMHAITTKTLTPWLYTLYTFDCDKPEEHITMLNMITRITLVSIRPIISKEEASKIKQYV